MPKLTLTRNGSKTECRDYVAGGIKTTTLNTVFAKTGKPLMWLLKRRGIFQWHWSFANTQLGKCDGSFDGEHRYKLYFLEATQGTTKQSLLLVSDPDNAGKGSGIELLDPINTKLLPAIINHFHKTWKNAQKETENPKFPIHKIKTGNPPELDEDQETRCATVLEK